MTRTHYVLLKAFVVTRNLRHWEAKSEQLTKITLKLKSHNLTLSRSHMIGTKWHMFFLKLLSRWEIWDTGRKNWSNLPAQSKITLKFNLHNLTFSHSQMFGTPWRMFFWKLLSRREIWDAGRQNWSNWPAQTKITLIFKSHTLTFSHSQMFDTQWHMFFWKLLLRREICDAGKQNRSVNRIESVLLCRDTPKAEHETGNS